MKRNQIYQEERDLPILAGLKYDSEKFNSDIDFGNIRLTVDYKEDLDNLKLLGEMIGEKKFFSLQTKRYANLFQTITQAVL